MKNGRYQEDGIELWYFNDELHREDGPACVEPDGTKSWYVHGQLHRIDGPAVIWGDGSQEWWVGGARHREDGPAVLNADGSCCWSPMATPNCPTCGRSNCSRQDRVDYDYSGLTAMRAAASLRR